MATKDRQAEIEALQRTEAAQYDHALTEWITKMRSEGVVEITAEEVFGDDLPSGSYTSVGAWPDAGGNIFQWIVMNNPSEFSAQAVTYVRYVSPDEQEVLGEAIVYNAGGRKTDSTTAIQLGTKLYLYPTGHELISGQRRNALDKAVWDVGAVPYAQGQKPKTGVGAAPVSDEQVFEDVPPDSTFYPFVQHMASIGAIGGYPCGGEGEPCIAPLKRPYFRPHLNATRGQIAKMISVAVGE